MRSHIPLTFPATRKALWCHASIGEPVSLCCPRLSLSVTEQVLYLAYGLSRTSKAANCVLGGAVNVEPDCSEIVIYIDQLEPKNVTETSSGSSSSFWMPTKVVRDSRHTPNAQLDTTEVEMALMHLMARSRDASKVEVSEFLSATAECTLFAGSNQVRCDLEANVVLPSSRFDLTPIDPVSVAMTALSKSVLGIDKHGVLSNQQKSGYLTMDQYRKVIFLLESDPKVLTVPIIGIWVSGVDLITHPYIWAACIRYMHTTQVRDRVPKPSEPFLLIHKSPLMSCAQHFDCTAPSIPLSYQHLLGSGGFSMNKEESSKRNGRLSVKAEVQKLSSPRGRQFAHIVQEYVSKCDIENIVTPRVSKKETRKERSGDDSLPWCSPFPCKSQGDFIRPLVPDVSLLDESNPQEAPKPERLALQKVVDCRLNCSPTTKHDNSARSHLGRHENDVARQIAFAEVDETSKESPLKQSLMPSKPVLASPSLRSRHPMNLHPDYHKQPRDPTTPTTKAADDIENIPFQDRQQMKPHAEHNHIRYSHPYATTHVSSPAEMLPQASSLYWSQPSTNYLDATPHRPPEEISQLPFTPTGRETRPMESHFCRCQGQTQHDEGYYGYPPTAGGTAPTNPLSVITENVHKLLSPRARRTSEPAAFAQLNVSPIETIGQPVQRCVPSTPSPLCTPSNQAVPISPQVEEILKQQDAQLKALQQQIHKLLKAQDNRPSAPLHKSATTQTTFIAPGSRVDCVMASKPFNGEGDNHSTSDTQDSAHDSSRSQSLLQHDLTTLDLPTQMTARSFTSDINVDYESYEDSLTGSPKRNESFHSQSEESWQSPVLGESVSMMAESLDQESTKQQLDVIIRNVRDLLAKHTPTKGGDNGADDQGASVSSVRADSSDSDLCPSDDSDCKGAEAKSSEVKSKDVALATRTQLRKMGIDMQTPNQTIRDPVSMLPRLQYISMVMTDSVISDSNKSLELNALALKYLPDDQLTELAQLTVHHSNKGPKAREDSLLRRVMMLQSRDDSMSRSGLEPSNMSMATQHYLKRYALDWNVSESESDQYSSALEMVDHTPANNLKSILRRAPHKQHDEEENNDGQDMSMQVLDISRLKELPKLL